MLPIETDVTMSIVLSLLHSIYIIARPYCTELARVPGTESTAGAPLIGVQNLLRMNCQQSSLARIRRDVSLRAESFKFMRFSGVGRRSS